MYKAHVIYFIAEIFLQLFYLIKHRNKRFVSLKKAVASDRSLITRCLSNDATRLTDPISDYYSAYIGCAVAVSLPRANISRRELISLTQGCLSFALSPISWTNLNSYSVR